MLIHSELRLHLIRKLWQEWGIYMTKAQVISELYENCKKLNILPYFVIREQDYSSNREKLIDRVMDKFKGCSLAVRSSYSNEDTRNESNAGKYVTILNVENTYDSIELAVDKVFNSYDSVIEEEVLIQPMLQDIIKSGVVFTRDLYSLAPYYCIDFVEGNDSAAITSGSVNDDKIVVIYRKNKNINDPDMKALVDNVKQIEYFLKTDRLDIEFAITKEHKVYIFQARPIANIRKIPKYDLDASLNRIKRKVEKLMRPHPFLLGRTTYFGVMPDWNPAEILGIRPKKLAISLYKELVTDNIWAKQREDYGYRDLTQHPLMVLFCGIPYIDTRITFNSFIPLQLNSKISEKLVNYYLEELRKKPAFHDKVEFEIVFSCYYLGLPDELKRLLKKGFNENEIKRIEYSLLDLTNKVINPVDGLYKNDINKIENLKANHKKIIDSEISLVDKIYWLIEECKNYGTLPFAGVARAAFIAVQFLRSFVKKHIVTQQEYDDFMCSLNTISKQISSDRQKLAKGEIDKEEFLNKYGYIRPGTYDIESFRYDEAFEDYFGDISAENTRTEVKKFEFTEKQKREINEELEQNGIDITADELLIFIKEAIEGREYLKFVFTNTVSEILVLIEKLGKRLNIPKEELAHLDIGIVKQLYVDLYSGNIADIFKENIRENKVQYEMAQIIKLPNIIISPNDVYQYIVLDEEPNYITMCETIGVVVTEDEIHNVDLDGKIVFIKSADPGWDFLFTKNIAGLVTQFGGANSHMAIRCSELGIPAVIGAGEKKYSNWCQAGKLLLDCANKCVKIIS